MHQANCVCAPYNQSKDPQASLKWRYGDCSACLTVIKIGLVTRTTLMVICGPIGLILDSLVSESVVRRVDFPHIEHLF